MTEPFAAPHRLLAEIHAETQIEEKRLHQMRTAGSDHFTSRMNRALPTMTDEDLDGYTREAGALAAMKNKGRL